MVQRPVPANPESSTLRRIPETHPPRRLEAGPGLVLHLAAHAGGQRLPVVGQEGQHGVAVAAERHAKRPGEGLPDHVVGVLHEALAHG